MYDIDGANSAQEKLILYSTSDYTLADSTSLIVETFSDRLELTSPLVAIDNPSDSSILTQVQEEHAVSFRFNNVSEFEIGYEAIGGQTGKGRNFFFAGDVVFDNTTPQITSFQAVPFEFSPGLGFLLSGGGLLGIHCLKKKRRATKSNVVE